MSLNSPGKAQAESMSAIYETALPYTSTEVLTGCAYVGETPVNYRIAVGGDRLVGVVPGLLGTEGMLDPLADRLAALGYTAISYGQARRGASLANNIRNPQLLHADTLTAVLDDAANHPDLTHKTFSQIDLVAHSMGTHPAFEYGVKHPEDVRSEIAAGASGVDEHFRRELVKRPLKFERQVVDMTRRHLQNPGHLRSVAKHTISNVPLLVGELTSCLTSRENFDRAQKLIAENIPTALIGFGSDQITPAEGLHRAATKLHIPYRELASPEAEHDAVIQHAGEVALTVMDLHAQFDSQRSLYLA